MNPSLSELMILKSDFQEETDENLVESSAPGQACPSSNLVLSAQQILQQGIQLLEALSAEQYTLKIPLAFHSSIGGHYRHCLDHFQIWLFPAQIDLVDYDSRQRNPQIEKDLSFAREITSSLILHLGALDNRNLDQEVWTRCTVSYPPSAPATYRSTRARELVYVVNHAIHHYAIISILARVMDIQLPTGFGIAPSTLAHQKNSTG